MTRRKGGITRSLKKTKEEAIKHRLREQMIFWEAIAQFDIEARVASIRSYLLEMIANEDEDTE